jgi:hypothetical protein
MSQERRHERKYGPTEATPTETGRQTAMSYLTTIQQALDRTAGKAEIDQLLAIGASCTAATRTDRETWLRVANRLLTNH